MKKKRQGRAGFSSRHEKKKKAAGSGLPPERLS